MLSSYLLLFAALTALSMAGASSGGVFGTLSPGKNSVVSVDWSSKDNFTSPLNVLQVLAVKCSSPPCFSTPSAAYPLFDSAEYNVMERGGTAYCLVSGICQTTQFPSAWPPVIWSGQVDQLPKYYSVIRSYNTLYNFDYYSLITMEYADKIRKIPSKCTSTRHFDIDRRCFCPRNGLYRMY